jgi:hypothetical protein
MLTCGGNAVEKVLDIDYDAEIASYKDLPVRLKLRRAKREGAKTVTLWQYR